MILLNIFVKLLSDWIEDSKSLLLAVPLICIITLHVISEKFPVQLWENENEKDILLVTILKIVLIAFD